MTAPTRAEVQHMIAEWNTNSKTFRMLAGDISAEILVKLPAAVLRVTASQLEQASAMLAALMPDANQPNISAFRGALRFKLMQLCWKTSEIDDLIAACDRQLANQPDATPAIRHTGAVATASAQAGSQEAAGPASASEKE